MADREHTSITKANDEIHTLRSQMGRVRDKAREMSSSVVMVTEVTAGGAAAGFIRGRYGDKSANLMGLEPDLVVGAACVLASYWVGGKYAPDLLHVGAGFGAGYAAMEFLAMGERMKREASGGGAKPYGLPKVA